VTRLSAATTTLFVTQYYRPELIGSGPVCTDLAEWLARQNIDVQVLTSRPHYPGVEVHPEYRRGRRDRERLDGVRIDRLPTLVPRTGSSLQRMAAEAWFLCHGLAALATGRIRRSTVVLSLCPSILAVLVGALAKRRGGRHVALVHDIQSGLAQGLGLVDGQRLPQLIQRLETTVLNRADVVVVLSDEMRRKLRAQGIQTAIEVLPIWIDTEAIYPMAAPDERPPTLLYSGNLGRKQGLSQVIDLATLLQARRPEVRVVLRGDGNRAEVLGQEVAQRNLRNIEFRPLLPPAQLNAGLADGDVHLVPQEPAAADFAVPSKIFGIMAAGRPFIATARPGSLLWRLRDESDAFVCVPPNDIDGFADAALQLIDDPGLRNKLGTQGREFVVERFAKQKILGDFLAVLDASR
jgi:colanic acid biosynthesis glycosyl transferase WcaI